MTCEIVLAILLLSLPTALSAATPTSAPPSYDVEDNSFSHTALLAPILSHLGFNELSMAVPSLASDTTSTAWSGPSTLFAPSDSSLHSCLSCSVPNILREHIVPALFTIEYLRKLPSGAKIETLSPGRCITVTRNNATSSSSGAVEKVFVGGVQITHPDLFNNGLVVIHGIEGYISPLFPSSCDFERLNTLSFPHYSPAPVDARAWSHSLPAQPGLMRLMMRDAMLRLRNNGFSILSVAMRVKFGELVGLNNFTVFAVDDASIFTGSHSYINSIRFHIVPNQYLTMSDLEKLPVGSKLSTLEREEHLVVTSKGESGFGVSPIRINYVRVKVGEVVKNMKIVVHSVYMAFPRFHGHKGVNSVNSYGGVNMEGGSGYGSSSSVVEEGGCLVESEDGTCTTATTNTPPTAHRTRTIAPMPNVESTLVDSDDHYGL